MSCTLLTLHSSAGPLLTIAADRTAEPAIAGVLFSGTALILPILALAFFFLTYQKKLICQQLDLYRIQSAYQKELLTAAIEAEERERSRIGNELHNEIGPALSAAGLLISQLAFSLTSPQKEQAIHIKEIMGQSIKNLRHLLQNLRPAVLAKFGLAEAIRTLSVAGKEVLAEGMTVHIDLEAVLPYQQELALYRIVQEAVANALQHAHASHISLQLTQHARQLVLLIDDNGCGFDYARMQQTNNTGLGLKHLEARVSLLNASLWLDSAPGCGTQICITIPLPTA